jgi:hypothetical protein
MQRNPSSQATGFQMQHPSNTNTIESFLNDYIPPYKWIQTLLLSQTDTSGFGEGGIKME